LVPDDFFVFCGVLLDEALGDTVSLAEAVFADVASDVVLDDDSTLTNSPF
jgi:hypothetical protein